MHKVHTENLSKPEKRALWDKIIQDFLASGQALKPYSQQTGLNYDHLSYYVSAYKRKQAKQFVEVDITASDNQVSGESLVIELRHCRLLLPLSVPALTLREILSGVVGC